MAQDDSEIRAKRISEAELDHPAAQIVTKKTPTTPLDILVRVETDLNRVTATAPGGRQITTTVKRDNGAADADEA